MASIEKPKDLGAYETTSLEETDQESARADSVFVSSEMRQAFRQIGISSFSSMHELYLHYKKEVVLEIREKGEPNQHILKNYPTVYIGSGVDVEYPLCLGARQIVFVDPAFDDDEALDIVADKIIRITERQPKNIAGRPGQPPSLSFTFDFGKGPEDTVVTFMAQTYKNEESTGFVIPERTGCIMEFLLSHDAREKGYGLDARSVRNKLVAGGMIIVCGQPLEPIKLQDEKRKYFLARGSEQMKQGVSAMAYVTGEARRIYGQYGYEVVPVAPLLADDKKNGRATIFLRKGYRL